MKIFNMKIRPLFSYMFEIYSEDITWKQMIEIDKIKSKFIRKLLSLPKNSNIVATHELAATPFFVE